MQLDNETIEQLKYYFNSKPEFGERLPNIRDVADKTIFYLKSQDTYIEYTAFAGRWYKKVIDSSSQVALEVV